MERPRNFDPVEEKAMWLEMMPNELFSTFLEARGYDPYKVCDLVHMVFKSRKSLTETVAEEAMYAFWDVVTKRFPDYEDHIVASRVRLEIAEKSKEWIEHWIEENS